MFESIGVAHPQALDDILKARHTVRKFSALTPRKEDVERIIRAGLIAPYASFPAAGKTDFRKVFVLPSGSPIRERVEEIIDDRMPKFAAKIESEVGTVPFVQRIKQLRSSAVSLLNGAPYFVIAGERIGTPPIAAESLSYCMQTMWLKATSLKIGFRPVTVVAHLRLGNDDEFCQLLDIPKREYALDGCALGYPAENYQPRQVHYPDFETNVRWL